MNNASAETTATSPKLVWARFDNGRILLVDDATGKFDTVVHVEDREVCWEEHLNLLSDAVTGSINGIENFVQHQLTHHLFRVTGQITDWHDPDSDAVDFEIINPGTADFGALADSLLTDVCGASHALASLGNDYGAESVIGTLGGREIRCAAHPAECDYVRITVPGVVPLELAYWSCDEWVDAPMEVMGAILGAARGRA